MLHARCNGTFLYRWLPWLLGHNGFSRGAKIKAIKSVQTLYDRKKQKFHREAFETSTDPIIQSQMYTPEALKTMNLSRLCHYLVSFGLQTPELMDRYAARAEELAASLDSEQFALILNAMSRASHRHDGMLQSFSKRMLPKLPLFIPRDLARVCLAYAKLQERDEVLFRRLALEMPHKLPLFDGRDLQMVARAFAKLLIRDDLLFDDIADEVIRRPQDLDHASLLVIASAFARFNIRTQRLWPVLGEWLLQSHLDFSAQDVGAVFNAFSTVDFEHKELFQTLLLSLSQEPLLSEASPSTLCLTFNAMVRLNWPRGHEAMEGLNVLVDKVSGRLADFDPVGLTQLLHACARFRPLQKKTQLVEGILEQCGEKIQEFPAQSLSLLVNSCARLQQKDVNLLTKVAKSAAPLLPEFTPQALAVTAYGFAKLEVRSEILFYLLAEQIVQKIPLFSGQGIGMVLQAYGKLHIDNKRLVQTCRKHLRSLSDELTLWEVDAIEDGFKQLDALDSWTETLLLNLRRQLSTAQVPVADDQWAEADLLQRLAKDSKEPQAARVEAEPKSSTSEPPLDLWELWSNAKVAPSTGMEASDDAATPPSRLREYLSRPEKIGRKAVVLGEEKPAEHAEPGAAEAGGGRKHRRVRTESSRPGDDKKKQNQCWFELP